MGPSGFPSDPKPETQKALGGRPQGLGPRVKGAEARVWGLGFRGLGV